LAAVVYAYLFDQDPQKLFGLLGAAGRDGLAELVGEAG